MSQLYFENIGLTVEAAKINSAFKTELENLGTWPYRSTAVLDYFRRDPSGGHGKIAWLIKLGFKWSPYPRNSKRLRFEAPTFLEFAKSYRRLMEEAGLRFGDYLRPARVLVKTENFQKTCLLYDPLTDPRPSADYKRLDSTEGFNLPDNVILDGIRKGKFPMLRSSVHDLMHFVTFLRHPWLSKVIVEAVRSWSPEQMTPELQRRLFWILETTCLPNTDRRDKIKNFLSHVRGSSNQSDIKGIKNKMESRTDTNFLLYADQLTHFMQGHLVDLSGGMNNSAEKTAFVLQNVFDWNTELSDGPVMPLNLKSEVKLARVFELHNLFTLDRSMLYAHGGSRKLQETLAMNLFVIAKGLELIHYSLTKLTDLELAEMLFLEDPSSIFGHQHVNLFRGGDGDMVKSLKEAARPALISVAKDFALMLEFALFEFSSNLTMQEYVEDMLKPNYDYDRKTSKYLRTMYNEVHVLNYYLGIFENRD